MNLSSQQERQRVEEINLSFCKFKSKNKTIGSIKIYKNLTSDKELNNIFKVYFESMFTKERLENCLRVNGSNLYVINRPMDLNLKRKLNLYRILIKLQILTISGRTLKEGSKQHSKDAI